MHAADAAAAQTLGERRTAVARDHNDLRRPGGAQIGDAALDHRGAVEGQQRLECPHAGGKPRRGHDGADPVLPVRSHFIPPFSMIHMP